MITITVKTFQFTFIFRIRPEAFFATTFEQIIAVLPRSLHVFSEIRVISKAAFSCSLTFQPFICSVTFPSNLIRRVNNQGFRRIRPFDLFSYSFPSEFHFHLARYLLMFSLTTKITYKSCGNRIGQSAAHCRARIQLELYWERRHSGTFFTRNSFNSFHTIVFARFLLSHVTAHLVSNFMHL